jgi:hypothetical protein
MPNKYRTVYLWTLPKGAEHDQMKPYGDGKYTLPSAMDADDLRKHLTARADEMECDMFFSFRKGGCIWRVYKSSESEDELNSLFSSTE